jgi:hypothetical protein
VIDNDSNEMVIFRASEAVVSAEVYGFSTRS